MEQEVSKKFQSIDILVTVWKRKKMVIVITILAAISSVVISLMMKDRFEAKVEFFPAKSNSVNFSGIHLNPKDNILNFGEEEEAEQLLQMLKSGRIRHEIINQFDLINHYEIDTNQIYWKTRLAKKYDKSVKFKRNRYGAIEISVTDESPLVARDMANTIASLTDTVKNEMLRERAIQAYEVVLKEYGELAHFINNAEDSMSALRERGALVDEQFAAYSELYATAISQKNKEAVKLKEILDKANKYSSSLMRMKELVQTENERLTLMKSRMDQFWADSHLHISHKFVTEYAELPDRKAYPKRSLIVIMSSFSAFIFSIFLAVLFEGIRRNKHKFSA